MEGTTVGSEPKTRKYFIELPANRTSWQEERLREYFINHSDVLRLTRIVARSFPLFWKKIGHNDDPIFRKHFQDLSKSMVKFSISNNHGDQEDTTDAEGKYEHYYFNLNDNVRKHLDKETLAYYFGDPKSIFYAFYEPTFFCRNDFVGYVQSQNQVIVTLPANIAHEWSMAGMHLEPMPN